MESLPSTLFSPEARQQQPRSGVVVTHRTRPVKPNARHCPHCSKIAWRTWELAMKRVEKLKASSRAKKPDTLDAYKCPVGLGWHVGHNWKLRWNSLGSEEHK
jgi:hypothetical protein